MKKYILRIISTFCAALVLVFCVNISAFALDEQPKITHVKGKNSASQTYKASKYYKYMTSLPRTDDNVTDLLAVALSQLGYMESDSDEDLSGTVGGSDNYTEFNYNMGDFGVGYGSDKYDWCASFVSYCLLQSRVTAQSSISDWCRNHVADETSEKYDPEYANYIWREVGCQKWADNLISAGYYQSSEANGGEYIPQSGDLIFFRWSPDKQIGHIGIVVYCDGERVYTIEGNTSGGTTMVANGGAVYFKNYVLDYSCIDGYGVLPYKTNDAVEKIDYSGNSASVGFYMTTAEKYLYSNESLESDYMPIPAYTMIKVVEVVEEGIDGMLRAVYDVGGEEIEGYIVNSSTERVIQLTAGLPEPEPESFLGFNKTDGFVSGEIYGYTLNGNDLSADDEVLIRGIGRIVLSARLDFENTVDRCGYYIDGDKDNISWIDGCVSESTEGGEKCEIWADMYGLSEGEHSVTFVFELDNGVIPIIDTLLFSFTNEPEPAPVEPEPTEEITEEPTEVHSDAEEATDAEETDAGCASSIDSFAFVAIVLIACVGYSLNKNKKAE